MNKKMGRPPLPKGESKDTQIAVRLQREQSEEFARLAAKAKQTSAESLRDAVDLQIQNPPIWVKSRWTKEELDEQLIAFRLVAPTRIAEGVGEMSVRQNPKGEIAVDIFVTEHQGYKGVVTRYWLAQQAVDKIELNPDDKQVKFKLIM